MKNTTRSWMALMGLSVGLIHSQGSHAQVSDCCGDTAVSSITPVATSYVVPTTQTTVLRPVMTVETPVVYEPTAYVVDRPNRGLFSGLFRPRPRPISFVETSYIPPTYDVVTPTYFATSYVPTTMTLDSSVVETTFVSTDPCGVPSNSTVSNGGSTVSHSSQGESRPTPTQQQVTPAPRPTVTSPPKNVQSRSASESAGAAASPPPSDGSTRASTELNEPAYEFPASPRPEKGVTEPPVPTGEGVTTPIDDLNSRSSFKPKPTDLDRQASSGSLGALRGQVITRENGKAESKVRVVFSDLRNTFKDRERETDANGRFEVLLPNGDWAVNVVEEDGKQTSYGSITASSGRFFDQKDRPVSSIRINH